MSDEIRLSIVQLIKKISVKCLLFNFLLANLFLCHEGIYNVRIYKSASQTKISARAKISKFKLLLKEIR